MMHIPDDVVIFSNFGRAVRFRVKDIKCSSRNSKGVLGIKLAALDFVVSIVIIDVEGNYDVFQEFLNALEKSLRIVDISKLSFSSVELEKGTGTYRYDVDIQTYWLTNR